jgi:RimJ/RimL family protein N-acetyltransferase
VNPLPPLPTTARLALRRFTPDDLDFLDRLNSDAATMRYLGGAVSRAESATQLRERILAYYEEHPGLGVWLLSERSSGAPVGFHLLNHIRGERHVQVGYRLLPACWGRGYATEMSRALLHYGFIALGLAQIVAITDPSNFASQRVLEKSGLTRRGERSFAHPAYARFGPQAWFERDAADWLPEADFGHTRSS